MFSNIETFLMFKSAKCLWSFVRKNNQVILYVETQEVLDTTQLIVMGHFYGQNRSPILSQTLV